MASAISSLPVPVSPLINTVASVGATIRTMSSTARRAGLVPIMSGNSLSRRDALSMIAGRSPPQVACAAIFLLLSLFRAALGGATEEVATPRFVLSKIAVYGFLAPNAKCSPRQRGKPLRVDVFIAILAGPKAAFVDNADSRTSVSKLVEFAVEVIN